MGRLTCKYEGLSALRDLCTFDKNNECIDCKSCAACCEEETINDCAFCPIQDAFDKLAEYEDAEEKGLLVILPVMPGETVYLIDNNTDACDECENFVVGYCEEYCKCNDAEYPQCAEEPLCEKQFLEVIEYKTNQKWILENKDDFGKRIFLTREEAEAALKKKQEEQK